MGAADDLVTYSLPGLADDSSASTVRQQHYRPSPPPCASRLSQVLLLPSSRIHPSSQRCSSPPPSLLVHRDEKTSSVLGRTPSAACARSTVWVRPRPTSLATVIILTACWSCCLNAGLRRAPPKNESRYTASTTSSAVRTVYSPCGVRGLLTTSLAAETALVLTPL